MELKFIKMQGLGNDFVIFDHRNHRPVNFTINNIKQIADRKYGIGCDQVIIMRDDVKYDCALQIFNANGSESFACGNATRCIAKIINKNNIQIKVGERVLTAELIGKEVKVNMGQAKFDWQDIPLSHATNALSLHFDHPLIAHGFAVNVGNPHLILPVEKLDNLNIVELGQFFSNHPLFPEQINVNFVSIRNKHELELRVFERGNGITLACGSGACATAAALNKIGLINHSVTVSQVGGDLLINIQPEGIFMTGNAEFSFYGFIDLSFN